MTEDAFRASVGNYKGVMLCTRPNQSDAAPKEKPFVSRVNPTSSELLGLNHAPAIYPERKKNVPPVMKKHMEFLKNLEADLASKKEEENAKQWNEELKYIKIRENAKENRQKTREMRQEMGLAKSVGEKEEISDQLQGTQEKLLPLTANNVDQLKTQTSEKKKKKKKTEKEKPAWAYTQKELVEKEAQADNELIEFWQDLNYEKYMEDLEVKTMLASLKNRINQLEDNQEEKKNIEQEIKKKKELKLKKKEVNFDESHKEVDVQSNASNRSEARSVASSKTQETIQSLKSKAKEEKEWENNTKTKKDYHKTLEERIAKHVADEILRNNKNLRDVYSNQSIRKILEQEAHKQLIDNKFKSEAGKIITNKDLDLAQKETSTQNMAYLYRNPCIQNC